MVDIFDEVSEDLRAERATALLRRYGILLVLGAVAVVLGATAWQAWQWRQRQQTAAVATTFLGAMRQATGPVTSPPTPAQTQAADTFAEVAKTGPEGYRTLARLREAAIRAAAGDVASASTLWDQVSADTTADPLLRSLADLLWVQHQVDAGDPAAVEGRLAPLVVPGNAWRPLAREAQAWLALRTGQDARARDILKELQADIAAPDGVRARAAGLLNQLGAGPSGAGG